MNNIEPKDWIIEYDARYVITPLGEKISPDSQPIWTESKIMGDRVGYKTFEECIIALKNQMRDLVCIHISYRVRHRNGNAIPVSILFPEASFYE